MSVEDFPHLTLTQVTEVDHLLDGLTEVPVINGITVDGLRALIPRLVAMLNEAEELADVAERAGFPLTEDVVQRYGSVARVYIQGPGAAQVRLDVGKKIEIVEVEDSDVGELDFFEPDEGWEIGGQVVEFPIGGTD